MANSGQQGGFYEGNEGGMGFQSYSYTGTGFDPISTLDDMLSYCVSPHTPTNMGTPFNKQQYSQPAESMPGIGFSVGPSSDQTNVNVQRTGTFAGKQHAPPPGTNHQISFSEQPSSDQTNANVRRKGTRKLTQEEADKKKIVDKAYRDRRKKQFMDMQSKFVELEEENNDLKKKINDLIDNSQSKTKMICQLKRVITKLKQKDKKENAFQQKLLKINDLDKFIEEGLHHYKKPTQDSFPSNEERHSEEEFLAGTEHVELDGDDSGDENDDSRKRKRHAARSARSARSGCSGKVSRVEDSDDELITLAAKKGSTSDHAVSWDNDPYSIPECIRILNSMEGISASVAMKATTKFASSDQRQIFVALKEDWRREWLKN